MSPIGVGVAVGEADVFGSMLDTFDAGFMHLHESTTARHAIANRPNFRFFISVELVPIFLLQNTVISATRGLDLCVCNAGTQESGYES